MKKTIILVVSLALAFAASAAAEDITLDGAGATFPYPVYSQWAYKYNQLKGIQLNYQSIGSGGGVAQIKAKTVDFGASDAPMKPEELNAFNLFQFPMVIGGVVPVLNVSGIQSGQLRIAPGLLADIFLGKITKWNDPAIAKLNPRLRLPNMAITVVHRADGSGTTWIFTNYLSKVSSEWKQKVGSDKAVAWPVGIGGKGNEGVAAYVQQVAGGIGYVEYAYALQNSMTYALLQNRSGTYVRPTIENFQTAAANADWKTAPSFHMVLTDQPGERSWPITGASFILVQKNQPDAARAKAMFDFFDWCFRHGEEIAKKLDYVPIPTNVVELVEAEWRKEVKVGIQP